MLRRLVGSWPGNPVRAPGGDWVFVVCGGVEEEAALW